MELNDQEQPDDYYCEWEPDQKNPVLCRLDHMQERATEACLVVGFILYFGMFLIVGYINYTFIVRDEKYTNLPSTIKIALPVYQIHSGWASISFGYISMVGDYHAKTADMYDAISMVGIMAGFLIFLLLHWQFCFHYLTTSKLYKVTYQAHSEDLVNEAKKEKKIITRQ